MRPRPHDDAGFSLPELLVTITLLTLLSGAIIGSVVAVQRNLGVANATMNDLAANRIALERTTTLLRGAVSLDGRLDRSTSALVVALPDRVRLYSVTGQGHLENPVQVEIAVEAGDLVERIWTPTPLLAADLPTNAVPTFAATPDRQRVIARDLVSSQVFTYWTHAEDASGAASRCGQVLADPATDGLDRVDSMSVRLRLQEPTGYDSAPSDLQGWARFASAADLGFSGSTDSAGCLDAGGFGYDAGPVAP